MPQTSRYQKRYGKKVKKGKGKKRVIILLVMAVAAVVLIFNTSKFYNKTENKLKKLSYPVKYSEYVEKAAQDYDLDPALIYSVMRTESHFDPEAQSSVGACGIMQIMPSSFEWLQEKRGCPDTYTSQDLFNPKICIDYGSYLLKYFLDYYGNERCAIAAYNAGFVVSDWLADKQYSADGENLQSIPYPETESYVSKVENAKQMYIKLYYSDNNSSK